MASFMPTMQHAARMSARIIGRDGGIRKLHQSIRLCGAHNLTMPAMSPTMTEGNIATWKVKEGDSYSVGDVLLEIETDKAQMDVEAQEDGVMAKIIQAEGSKGVQVGERIAVWAEPGDDLASLEIPEEDSPKPAPKESKKNSNEESQQEAHTSSPPTASAPKQESPSGEAGENTGGSAVTASSPGHGAKSSYPLYPSVINLMHINGISESEAKKIPTSGPGGRLLKGDVLAYVGSIDKSYPKKQSERLEKLAALDLSNINVASKDPSGGKGGPDGQKSLEFKAARVSSPESSPPAEMTVTISLKTVTEVQQRISRTLGIEIPLSEFISRAVAISNTDLPPISRAPTADELFNQVLGLDKISSSPLGWFNPQIVTMPPVQRSSGSKKNPKSDIIDILTGKQTKPVRSTSPTLTASSGGAAHVFSIVVPKGEEKRAKVFLERVKTILQVDPGRLVL